MTSTTIEPGCNMPCISFTPKNPRLFAYTVEATETGLVSALGDEDERRSRDRYKHLVFFPTWSQGEMAYCRVKPGEKFWVEAHSEDGLQVVDGSGQVVAKYTGKVVVMFHDSLGLQAVEDYYTQ